MSNDIVKFAAIVVVAGMVGSQFLAQKTFETAQAARVSRPEPARQPVVNTAVASGRTETIESRSGHYFARVEVDNRQIEMLVDTGASIIALTREDADRLAIHPSASEFNLSMSTANGTVRAARVRLTRVRIGQVEVSDVEAVVMPARALSQSLLGMSFLRKLSGFEVASGRLVLRQ